MTRKCLHALKMDNLFKILHSSIKVQADSFDKSTTKESIDIRFCCRRLNKRLKKSQLTKNTLHRDNDKQFIEKRSRVI